MATNEVRIIGGKFRGRKLRFPDAPGLRPTLGRSRETLFNWLVGDIVDARCLDLFAGSGALGFEALSRGARRVTFVEQSRAVADALRQNAAQLCIPLGTDVSSVHCLSAERFLRSGSRHRRDPQRADEGQDSGADDVYDLVFLDPPFDSGLLGAALVLLRTRQRLAPDALVYVEADRRQAVEHPGYEQLRSTRAGDTQSLLLRLAQGESAAGAETRE